MSTVEEQFKTAKDKIAAGWPADRIVENTDHKIVVQCENGTYLIHRYLPPVGTNDEFDALMGNKVLMQYTEDLEAPHYKNIGPEIMGQRDFKDEKIKEAIQELSLWIQVGSALV